MADGGRFRRWANRLATGLCLALVVAAVAIKYLVGWYFTIPQDGMYPTLPAKSTFFGLYNPYRDVKDVRHGDIVIFNQSQGTVTYTYIWRVVGLPGESVSIDDGRVTLDGKRLPVEKVRTQDGHDIYREANGEASYEVALDHSSSEGLPKTVKLTVPAGHLFLLGDNRQHASDSRIMGPIPFNSVFAKKW